MSAVQKGVCDPYCGRSGLSCGCEHETSCAEHMHTSLLNAWHAALVIRVYPRQTLSFFVFLWALVDFFTRTACLVPWIHVHLCPVIIHSYLSAGSFGVLLHTSPECNRIGDEVEAVANLTSIRKHRMRPIVPWVQVQVWRFKSINLLQVFSPVQYKQQMCSCCKCHSKHSWSDSQIFVKLLSHNRGSPSLELEADLCRRMSELMLNFIANISDNMIAVSRYGNLCTASHRLLFAVLCQRHLGHHLIHLGW